MLSAHEKLKLMKMKNSVSDKLEKIGGYRDLLPDWIYDNARYGLHLTANNLAEALEDEDPSAIALYCCHSCVQELDPLSGIPAGWQIGDIKKYIEICRRGLETEIDHSRWRRVACIAMRIEQLQAAADAIEVLETEGAVS